MLWIDSGFTPFMEEALQTLMFETSYHKYCNPIRDTLQLYLM